MTLEERLLAMERRMAALEVENAELKRQVEPAPAGEEEVSLERRLYIRELVRRGPAFARAEAARIDREQKAEWKRKQGTASNRRA